MIEFPAPLLFVFVPLLVIGALSLGSNIGKFLYWLFSR